MGGVNSQPVGRANAGERLGRGLCAENLVELVDRRITNANRRAQPLDERREPALGIEEVAKLKPAVTDRAHQLPRARHRSSTDGDGGGDGFNLCQDRRAMCGVHCANHIGGHIGSHQRVAERISRSRRGCFAGQGVLNIHRHQRPQRRCEHGSTDDDALFLQVIPEHFARPVKSHAKCVGLDAKFLAHFLGFQPAEIMQDQRHAIFCRQPVDFIAQDSAKLVHAEVARAVVGFPSAHIQIMVLHFACRAAFLAALHVKRQPLGDALKPRAKILNLLSGFRPDRESEKDGLCGVFGFVGISRDLVAHVKNHSRVAADDFFKRGLIASGLKKFKKLIDALGRKHRLQCSRREPQP